METFLGYQEHTLITIYTAISFLGFLGLVGNFLVMIVWILSPMKSSSAILAIALAATDILVLLSSIDVYFYPLHYNFKSTFSYIGSHVIPHIHIWLYPVSVIAETATVYLTLAVTLERYIAVSYPFDFRILWTFSRSCLAVALVTIFSVLFNLCRFWEFELEAQFDIYGRIIGYNINVVEFGLNPLYVSLYLGWAHLIVRFLVPLTGIVGFNVAIYRQLQKAKSARETMTGAGRSEVRLTVMLMYIVIEFVVCSSIVAIYAICYGFAINRSHLGFNLDLLAPVNIFFRTYNSSINFVTYIVFRGSFRSSFLLIFGCHRGKCAQFRRSTSPSGRRRLKLWRVWTRSAEETTLDSHLRTL